MLSELLFIAPILLAMIGILFIMSYDIFERRYPFWRRNGYDLITWIFVIVLILFAANLILPLFE